MTTLDVTLSSGFISEVGGTNDASVYAIAFDTHDTVGAITTLVADGTVQGNGTTVAATLLNGTADTAFDSGKVYIVLQGPGATASIGSEIAQQSDLNITTAAADHFAYDSMEVNLANSTYDVANLTSVVGFAVPMEISVPYSNGTTATVGFNVSGNSIISALTASEGNPTADIAHFLTGSLAAEFPTALSPSAVISAATPNPAGVTFQSANWAGYVAAVGSLLGTAEITLSGAFVGATDTAGIYHDTGYYAYNATFDAGASLTVNGTVETGVFELVPTQNSEIQGVIAVSTTQLEDSIYSTLGTAEIFNSTAEIASGAAPQYTIGTGANDQWGAVLRTFLVGFTGGYYGGSARSPNAQITSTIDLDNSVNWDPSYAFRGNTLYPVSNPVTVAAGQVTDDPYAQVFYDNSNSYGAGYSDALMNAYSSGGPQVPVYDPGTGLDVATLDLTLFADSEQPSGYTTPRMFNYIAPTGTAYAVPDSTATGANLVFDTAVASKDGIGTALSVDSTVTLDFLTSDAGGVAGWAPVTLDGATQGGLWQQWNIGGDAASGYTATASGIPQAVGNFQVNDFPVLASGTGTEWYQIGVGGKTFDLYAVTQNGSFDNPGYSGANQQGSIAVDGLASISPPATPAGDATINTFTVNLADGSQVAIDPSQMAPTTGLLGTVPDAPVALVLNNGTFTALGGQSSQATNTITATTTSADLAVAFGWTGVNNSTTSTASWISGFTNKVGALDTVEVTITPVGGGTTQTATTTADLDGDWQTGTIALGAGSTYDITMAAYRAGVTGAVTPTSQVLELDLACFVSGTRILTARGGVAVEHLAVGDLVWAHGAGLTPVRWIGWRHVECGHHASPRDAAPVRVVRGAFAPDVPHRDLLLSPDHAVFADGVLIPVRYLVNGRTVRREAAEAVTYCHVELAHHDVILAEGLACESYLDTGNRAIFANAQGVKADDAFALGVWDTDACAPLVIRGEKLAAVRRHLLDRAQELGHMMTLDPALRLVADGRVVRGQRTGRVARFRLPASARDVRLVSRSFVPAHTGAGPSDHRQLGVAVSEIRVDGDMIALGDARLRQGWHRLEQGTRGETWRWTDGDAGLTLAGGNLLEVEVAWTEAYWRDA